MRRRRTDTPQYIRRSARAGPGLAERGAIEIGTRSRTSFSDRQSTDRHMPPGDDLGHQRHAHPGPGPDARETNGETDAHAPRRIRPLARVIAREVCRSPDLCTRGARFAFPPGFWNNSRGECRCGSVSPG